MPALKPLDTDELFFSAHPDRRSHIRDARANELSGEFFSLGPHDSKRRRILCWRTPSYHPMAQRYPILRIPFLALADETIVDDDAVLLPLIDQIMRDAATQQLTPEQRKALDARRQPPGL